MQGPYADHILDASDVCSNCFRVVSVERVDPVMGDGLGHELDSHYSRHKRETSVEFHDSEPEPTQAKGVFCKCGVEGSHERLWEPGDVDRDRFADLLKSAIRSVATKGVALKPDETISYAVSHWREHDDVDRALATALDAGVVAAAASPENHNQETA